MKDLYFIGASQSDLKQFPDGVKKETGFALFSVQMGELGFHTKPLKGFGSSKVRELVIRKDDTYRVVYTVMFRNAVYVLHVFKKKSKTGIKTPAKDINLIKERLKVAKEHYKEHYGP